MTSFFKATLIWAAIAIVGAVTVVGLGLYNVSARQGHLPGVSWVLHAAYRSAVQLRAPSEEEVPDLSSPSLIKLGEEHYASACVFCHALPDQPQSQTALSMLPAPPHITEAVAEWEPRHMFWIVKNGVKMSGMPAWPSGQRDDDVWAVVAFLNAIKQGYGTVTGAQAERERAEQSGQHSGIEMIYQSGCARCHGEDGFADGNVNIPRLDALSAPYIAATLQAYRSGARQSGIMQQAASQLDDARIAALADHISGLRPNAPRPYETSRLDEELVARGGRIANGGDQKANIPSCTSCHGPANEPRSDRFPPLAGQSAEFLFNQLELWRSGNRGGTDRAVLMHEAVPALSEGDTRALAQYYASLSPSR